LHWGLLRLKLLRLVLGLMLESLVGLVDLLALVLFLSSVLLEFLGEVVNLWRVLTDGSVWFDLWIGGLIEVAELQLVLLRVIQQLWCPGRGRVQGTVVLLVRRRRRWVMRHLGQHPVFYLEL
jgi:hypothetical protein